MATLDNDDRAYLALLVKPLRDDIDRHENDLHGNGQPGIIQRQHDTDIEVAALRATQGRVSLGVIFSAIGSAAATAAAIAAIIRLGQS